MQAVRAVRVTQTRRMGQSAGAEIASVLIGQAHHSGVMSAAPTAYQTSCLLSIRQSLRLAPLNIPRMATDPATTPTPTNPTSSTTPPSPATSPGPITRLPLEILVHTLHKLRELCPNPLERQTESVKLPRVCRSFHSAYLLSDAVHECVVDFTERARKLVEALRKPGGSHLKPYSLVLNLNSNRVDDLIADLVWLCVAELRAFVWNPGSAGAHPTSFEQTRLYQAWNNCPRLTKFAVLHQQRVLSGGRAERRAESDWWC